MKPIDDKFAYAQNGITAMIAPVGCGKSYNYLKLMAKQEHIFNEPFFELSAICSTSNPSQARGARRQLRLYNLNLLLTFCLT